MSTGQKSKQPCWSVRICGDTTEYANSNPALGLQSNAVVVVRSLVWPGSYTFFFDGKVQQIYLGHGRKFSFEQKPFPVHPPMVMSDPEEYEDGPEPTPLEEPPKEEEKEDSQKEDPEDSEQ